MSFVILLSFKSAKISSLFPLKIACSKKTRLTLVSNEDEWRRTPTTAGIVIY